MFCEFKKFLLFLLKFHYRSHAQCDYRIGFQIKGKSKLPCFLFQITAEVLNV